MSRYKNKIISYSTLKKQASILVFFKLDFTNCKKNSLRHGEIDKITFRFIHRRFEGI